MMKQVLDVIVSLFFKFGDFEFNVVSCEFHKIFSKTV